MIRKNLDVSRTEVDSPALGFPAWQHGFDPFKVLGMLQDYLVESCVQYLLSNIIKSGANLNLKL